MPTFVTDGHTGWTCNAGASLIVEAWQRERRPHTLHAVIYVCQDHQPASEEWIAAAELVPEVTPAGPGHSRDPWPCGHITAYDSAGEELISNASDPA